MAKKSKKVRDAIILEHKDTDGKVTYFYHTHKNKRNTPDRIKLTKYNPVLRQHTEFTEKK